MADEILCPGQQAAYEQLTAALPIGSVFVVHGGTGTGKTLLLQQAHRDLGGALLTMEQYVEALRRQNPLAMDVGNLPPALIRSGRIELWLETRLPDLVARAAILADRAAKLPAALKDFDIAALALATEALTGADIKRVVEDGKILYAYDRSQNRALKPITEYFLEAIQTVRANKEQYAVAEARARAQHHARPPWFDIMSKMSMSMADEPDEE